jgi:hypothetical protein
VTALAFLAIALVISLVGCAVLYLRSRQPTSLESGIDAFQREMRALSPEEEERRRRPRTAPTTGPRHAAPPRPPRPEARRPEDRSADGPGSRT